MKQVYSRHFRMYETDFGRIRRSHPRVVRHARNDAAIVEALASASRDRLAVTVRGAGHSCCGQTLSHAGMLLVNVPDRASKPGALVDSVAEISAGERWRRVERWLNSQGRCVPVLPDYLGLSVGGTLSVGGYGMDSVRHGAQIDHVERLRVITPSGEPVWCSGHENAELFAYALGGLGQVGVIDRVVIRTVPHQPFTTLFRSVRRSLADLIGALEWIPSATESERPMLCKALASGGRFELTYGVPASTLRAVLASRPPGRASGREPMSRLLIVKHRQLRSAAVKLWLLRFPRHSRLWSDYLLDFDGLRSFEAFLRPLLARDSFRGCLRSIYVAPIRRLPRPVTFPLEAMGPGGQPTMFGIGLYSLIPNDRPDLVSAVAETVRRCLDGCLDRGGRPYLYGWHDLSDETLRSIYGPSYDAMLALKRRLDPSGLFQPHTFTSSGTMTAATW